jgi:hypothetical protein
MINMFKQSKIPTLVGIFMLLLGVGASVFLVQSQKQTSTNAAADKTPQQVRITNVSDKSFTVSWITEKATTGYLSWGKSTSLGQATDADKVAVIHHITINNLSPQTSYYFKIGADKTLFTNQGKAYTVKTASALTGTPNNDVVFGTILTTSGSPADAIVYISAAGIAPVSTTTNNEGKWSIPLSTARSTNLSAYASYSKDTQLDIVITGGQGQSATGKILAGAAKPVPAIKIGEFKDFTNLQTPQDGTIPTAQLNIPNQGTDQSTFNLSSFSQTAQKLVTLSSPKDREVLSSNQPQFSGTGTPGLTFTITVQSEIITDTIIIPKNGTWKWTVPNKLEPGTHSVKLTWQDSASVTRTISRNFTISQPTSPIPSPSLSPSPAAGGTVNIPSPVPSPTVKPSPSPIPTPSPSIKPTPTSATTSGIISSGSLPSSGNLTITLSIFIMGLILTLLGLFPNVRRFGI